MMFFSQTTVIKAGSLSEYYILPGLIDAHTHLCTDVEIDASWQGKVTEYFHHIHCK